MMLKGKIKEGTRNVPESEISSMAEKSGKRRIREGNPGEAPKHLGGTKGDVGGEWGHERGWDTFIKENSYTLIIIERWFSVMIRESKVFCTFRAHHGRVLLIYKTHYFHLFPILDSSGRANRRYRILIHPF